MEFENSSDQQGTKPSQKTNLSTIDFHKKQPTMVSEYSRSTNIRKRSKNVQSASKTSENYRQHTHKSFYQPKTNYIFKNINYEPTNDPKIKRSSQDKLNNIRPNRKNQSFQHVRSHSVNQSTFYRENTWARKNSNLEKKIQEPNILTDNLQRAFYSVCIKKQEEFLIYYQQRKFDDASAVEILNYTIDLNDCSRFLYAIKVLGDFYYSVEKYFDALKFYDQLRQAANFQKKYEIVAVSLMSMAKCTYSSHLFAETVSFLKKGLEYSWISESKDLQIKVYDQLGRVYYKMGHLEKARSYHDKFSYGIFEDQMSPLKNLSKQKIQELQLHNIELFHSGLNTTFLILLQLPYKQCQDVPTLSSDRESLRNKLDKPQGNIIAPFSINNVEYHSNKILRHWMFDKQTEQPFLNDRQNQENDRLKKSHNKNNYVNFKMNQYLRSKGIKPISRGSSIVKQKIQLKFKQSLDERINKKVKQPGLMDNWYELIVKEVVNDQKRRLNRINSPICIKKSIKDTRNQQMKAKLSFFTDYFRAMMNLSSQNELKNSKCFMRDL